MNNQLLKAFEGKRQKPNYSTASIESWILPSWFIKQSDPLSPGYVLGISRFVNTCYRNWTSFCNENGEPVLIIDMDGTISFPKIGVSVEVWINDGKRFFTPGRFLRTEQKSDPEFLGIETKNLLPNGIFRSLIFPIEGLRNPIFGLDLGLYATGESAFSNFLVFLVVRPYDHNGLTAINRLEYKNKRIKVNNNELFQLENEPKIVFCTHAGLGDVTEYFKVEQNSYTVTSLDGSCTGLVGYSIRPADRIGIKLFFKPDSFKIFFNQEKDFTQKWFFDSKQIWFNQNFYQYRMLITNSEIDSVYQKNLNYLKMFNGPGSDLIDINNIFVLNRYAFYKQSRIYLIKTLKKIRWDGSISNNLTPGKFIYALADYYQFTGDSKIVKDNWQLLKRIGYWLVQNQASLSSNLLQDRYENQVWICASFRALSLLSEAVGDFENFQFYHQYYQELWSQLLGFFSRKIKENSDNEFRKRRPVREAISILSLSYPLQLFQRNERFVKEWIDWIIERSTFNGGVVSPIEFQGVDLKLTAQIGEILLREGASYDPAFQFLSGTISSTGSWPDRTHPVFGGGIGATGHAPEVCCHFLLFLRNIMIMEEGEILYLLPGIFTSKLWNDLNIALNNIPTTFGKISLKCRNIGKIVQIEFEASFRKRPRQIMLIHNMNDRLLYSNTDIVWDGEYAYLDPDFKIVRFSRGLS